MEHGHHGRKSHWTQDSSVPFWAPVYGFPLSVFAVQLPASGREVYGNKENRQEQPRIVTCLILHFRPCSMSKVRCSLRNHHLCLLCGTVMFSGHIESFYVVRRLLLLPKAFQRLESVWPEKVMFTVQGHKSWWPLYGGTVLWRCHLCLPVASKLQNIGY